MTKLLVLRLELVEERELLGGGRGMMERRL